MKSCKDVIRSMVFIIMAVVVFISCDDSLRPPSVSSADDVEIFIPAQGDTLTVAEFSCSRLNSSDEDYRIQLSQDVDFSNVEFEVENGWYEGIRCRGLYAGNWYVRVSARIDDGDWGDWSPGVSFTAVSTIDSADVSLIKVNDNELRVDWPDVEGADYYKIYWGPEAGIDERYDDREVYNSVDYFWLAGNAANWGHYYFRIGADDYGIISEPIHLTNIWKDLSPLDGEVVIDTTPLLQWDDIEGSPGYQIEFADSAAGLNGGNIKSVSVSEYQVSAGDAFTIGDTIYWRIRSQTSFGTWEPWCDTLSFDVINSSALAVGDIFKGGYIFDLPGGGTGHCVSLHNVELIFDYEWEERGYAISFQYGDDAIDINGTGTAPELTDDGAANTEAIIAELGDFYIYVGSYAAKVCADLETACYDDWFLPAINQLTEMGGAIGSNGSFNSNYYWSSTEVDVDEAQGVDIPGSSASTQNKNVSGYVRAVRSFTY